MAEKLRPPGMIIEMPRDQRNINIAALTDGLAIIHRLENREQPRMFLYQPRNRVQVTRTRMRSERLPSWRCRPRCLDSSVNVSRRALRYRGQFFSIRGIDGVEVFARGWSLPVASDEMLEAVTMALQPRPYFLRIFWSRTVFHAHEFFGNAHWRWLDSVGDSELLPDTSADGCDSELMQSDGDTPPSTAQWHDVPVAAQCHRAGRSLQSETSRPAATTNPALL